MADETEQHVMIALLPTSSEWCKLKLPHLTLVYAGILGEDVEITDVNVLGKDAASLAMMNGPVGAKVTGVETFGGEDDDPVDVLTLETTMQLRSMRHFVERWNRSQHDEWRPHCTIGGSPGQGQLQDNPLWIGFDRICVAYGDEVIPFWLKGSY